MAAFGVTGQPSWRWPPGGLKFPAAQARATLPQATYSRLAGPAAGDGAVAAIGADGRATTVPEGGMGLAGAEAPEFGLGGVDASSSPPKIAAEAAGAEAPPASPPKFSGRSAGGDGVGVPAMFACVAKSL